MPQRLRPFLFLFTASSWLLLLLSSLSHASAAGALEGGWPRWTTLAAQALFVLGMFLYVRTQPEPLRGQNFVGLLRRMVLGPGLLALGGMLLYAAEQQLEIYFPAQAPLLFTLVYTINIGLFIFYIARLNYAWRSLVLFKSSAGLQRSWLLFELLLGVSLLFLLLNVVSSTGFIYGLLVGLGLYGMYLSANQKWIAYLNVQQKWYVMAYELAILCGLLLFIAFFRHTQDSPRLPDPGAQQTFLLLNSFFAAFYAGAGLLVTFFNLPTAGIFEQRRSEILSLQRLTQVIQRGQTAADIYNALLDSAAQTTRADAAWLDIVPLANAPVAVPTGCFFQLSTEQAHELRSRLQRQGLLNTDFLSNNFGSQPDFADFNMPFRSLVVRTLRTETQHYGTLYLLKSEPHGFEQDDLSMLLAFTSQTVLSLENLQLAMHSQQNQNVQNELRIAAHIQESLIPKKLPTDDWFEISSHALAAKEVGGDFYDLLLLPGKRLAVLIGDVSGKGVTAAFHMAQMKGIFHSLMQPNPLAKSDRTQYPVPSQFMTQANSALTHCLEKSSFITASLFLIDYENGGFMFARAGHCHTLYYSSNQEKSTLR